MDLDVAGPDISGENQFNLNPGSGIDPGRLVRAIPTAATAVYPETSSELVAPVSVTAAPRGSETRPIAAAPGRPVDLAPVNPVRLAQAQPVAPVVTRGSIAPTVSTDAVDAAGAGDKPRPAQYPGEGKGVGGTLRRMDPGYQGPDVNPLEQERQQLIARRDIAARKAQGPLMQILDTEWSKNQAKEAELANQRIGQIDQQLQAQKTNAQYAKNMGIEKNMGATADTAAINEQALEEWRKNGNLNAYKGLHGAGLGGRADLYMDEGIAALGKKTDNANTLIERLSNAPTQPAYNQIRNDILKGAKTPGHDYSQFGISDENLPKTKTEFDARRPDITAKLNNASTMVSQFQQKQRELSQVKPITDEKVGGQVTGRHKFATGEVMPNTSPVTLPNGAQGAQAQQNSKDLHNYGTGGPNSWNNATPGQAETFVKQLATEEVKGALGQYKMAKAFSNAANNNELYKYPAGHAFLADALGAIGRDVAEGSKAAGSIGLVKILESKYGGVENFLNGATNNWAAYKAWVQGGRKGEEVKLMPRLTQQSIEGYKAVANFKMEETKKELDRLGSPIETAGRYGIALDKLGLDKETQELVKPIHSKAVEEARLAYDKYPYMVVGSTRVMLPEDANVPGMKPAGGYAKERGTAAIETLEKAPPGSPPPPATPGGPPGGPPSTVVPSAINRTPAAQVVYGAAGETAHNLSGGNVNVAKNAATIVTSSAQSESDFKHDATHDVDPKTGQPIGQGLFGHNADRLKALQTFAGVPATGKPGAPIPPDVQSKFFARELMTAASTDRFIAATLNNPNATAEDLTKVQIRLEKPAGYKGPGTEEKVPSWNKRLASTRLLAEGPETQAPPPPAGHTQAQTPASLKLPYPNPKTREEAQANYAAGQRQSAEEAAAYIARRNALAAQATTSAANIAPAALGTAGAVVGSVGGPVGTLAGGTAGGAAGGAIKNYFTGGEANQNLPGYAKATGIGAAQGAVAGIPGAGVAGTAARVIGSGVVGGTEAALEGAEAGDIVNKAGGSMLGAAVGEAFGQALGMTGHKIYNYFSGTAKAEVQAAAKVLAEQQPKNVLADGKTVENIAYTKAEKLVKDRGLDPDHAAYAYNQVAAKASKGEALTQRPGEVEKVRAAAELEKVKNTVGDAGAAAKVTPRSPPAGAPFKAIPGGPVDSILTGTSGTGKLAATYMPEAVHAENLLQKSAANMRERWENAATARTTLLEHERKAIRDGDEAKEKAMRTIADTVRDQQEKMARAVLPQKEADALIQHLKTADTRYRKAMLAGGDNIVKTIAAGGSKGNTAKEAFEALAGNDHAAKHIMNSLVRAENRKKEGTDVLKIAGASLAAAHFVPLIGTAAGMVGGAVTAAKAGQMLKDWMVQRGAGKTVSFKQLMAKEMTDKSKLHFRASGAALGGAVGGEAAESAMASPAP